MPTKIEWCDEVWNPVTGCTPISEGCKNCYAARMAKRLGGRYGYPANDPFRVTFHPDRLNDPLKSKQQRRIFVCSMGDLFHDEVPFNHIAAIFGVMVSASRHTFMLLTKRPDRAIKFFEWVAKRAEDGRFLFPYDNNEWRIWQMLCVEGRRFNADIPPHHGGEWPLPNVLIGVTAENQEQADKRIPVLLHIPAAVRFVSVEPMLGPVDFQNIHLGQDVFANVLSGDAWCAGRGPQTNLDATINWVICGGETGPGARPMHPDWVRSLRDQCFGDGVPFFFKCWGDWGHGSHFKKTSHVVFQDGQNTECTRDKLHRIRLIHGDGYVGKGSTMARVGKKAAGRMLDGQTWDQIPAGP
ncbi:MAG: phage Gp37/Gp68 family protein [Desulfobacterales bacterium]|jgi:protein gp37|nr:phage Gp37/Gp68 family protein [Desulfobacterales bacterium]